jgi:hypothetical protein
MKTQLRYVGMLSVVMLCALLATGAQATIIQNSADSAAANAMVPNYSGCAGMYGGYPTEYCVKWVQGQWVPVQVMMPGRWEYRRVWLPGYPMTLYRQVPGYWQTTNYHNGVPDVSVWKGQNEMWYGMPYQGQQSQTGGFFDASGVWQSYPQYPAAYPGMGCPQP